ncbi:hypothetical protein K501DRAFT_279091 [Backusella circina FSU 941]|nr:hypothetical protein K501DRAFT_279091 [Backusella circina FSU 941]
MWHYKFQYNLQGLTVSFTFCLFNTYPNNTDSRNWKNDFRTIAEEHCILRRDAINFAYYLICAWLESPQPKNTNFPKITDQKFWLHCYRRVANITGVYQVVILSIKCNPLSKHYLKKHTTLNQKETVESLLFCKKMLFMRHIGRIFLESYSMTHRFFYENI